MRRTHYVCTIEGCGRAHDAKGLCRAHYRRWKRHGDPLAPLTLAPAGSGWISNGYRVFNTTREHIAVAEKALGKALPPGAIVHHIDENRLNNEPSNLVICPGNGYHGLLHQRMDARAACGNPNWRKCPYCHQHDDPANMRLEKSGRCVHRKCSAKARNTAYAKRRAA